MSYKSKTIEKIAVAPDLEIHLRRIVADGQVFASLREHIPSTKTDGRGITIPATRYQYLMELVQDNAETFGVAPRIEADPNAPRLFEKP